MLVPDGAGFAVVLVGAVVLVVDGFEVVVVGLDGAWAGGLAGAFVVVGLGWVFLVVSALVVPDDWALASNPQGAISPHSTANTANPCDTPRMISTIA